MDWFMDNLPELRRPVPHRIERDDGEGRLLSIVSPEQLRRILRWLLDENEFLSPHGVRALSAAYRDHPFSVDLGGMTYTVDYAPGESTTGLFGGNSNWRGPVWFPVNCIVIEASAASPDSSATTSRRISDRLRQGADARTTSPTSSCQRLVDSVPAGRERSTAGVR